MRAAFLALRPQQWTKNVLVFVPAIMAHRFLEWSTFWDAALAFASFSLCASAGYIYNDLRDRSADRGHPTKRHRPIASGALPVSVAVGIIPFLVVASFATAGLISPRFVGILALYLGFSLSYSWIFKRIGLVDVLVLAGLYTLRIIGGGEATSTPTSFWLLAFAMFLFLSFALAKRYAELSRLVDLGEGWLSGRGYHAADLDTLAQFGSASTFVSVLVLALYINGDSVLLLYSRPEVIWLVCPLVLYLMGRMWILARRGDLDEDPLVYLLKNRRSQGLILLGALLFWLAI
jgi:4-hydroxybenzoate polyprenyltransferase